MIVENLTVRQKTHVNRGQITNLYHIRGVRSDVTTKDSAVRHYNVHRMSRIDQLERQII